jgi:hypothetical protein
MKLVKYIVLIGAVCAAFTLQTAPAGTITGSAGSGFTAVAATANFTFGDGTLSLILSNDIAANDFRSAGQALSDFSFTLSNGTTLGGSLDNITGQTVNIAFPGGAVTDSGIPVTSTDWELSATNGSTFLLTALIMSQPDFMIAPAGTVFPNVNSSVDNFNPYLLTGPVTFSISGDFTADTTISSATFSFGTAPETFVPGTVPDSGTTALLLGAGLSGLGFVRRFVKR